MRMAAEFTRDIHQTYQRETEAGRVATTRGIRERAETLKTLWRGEVRRAGLGRRLPNTIRAQHYPKNDVSFGAASVVSPRGNSANRILHSHSTGGIIRASGTRALYLAVPTSAAPRSLRGGRIDPHEFEQRLGIQLRLIRRRGGRAPALVADGVRIDSRGVVRRSRSKTGRNQVSAVIFNLVPQVRLRRRLNLSRHVRSVGAGIPRAIAEQWARPDNPGRNKPTTGRSRRRRGR